MTLAATVRAERFLFEDLRTVFAKANEEKSGDRLAGLAAVSERERVAAKRALAELTLAEIVARPVTEPEEEAVSRLTLRTHDRGASEPIQSWTVGEFREFLLDDGTAEEELRRLHWAITPEIAAAVAKLM